MTYTEEWAAASKQDHMTHMRHRQGIEQCNISVNDQAAMEWAVAEIERLTRELNLLEIADNTHMSCAVAEFERMRTDKSKLERKLSAAEAAMESISQSRSTGDMVPVSEDSGVRRWVNASTFAADALRIIRSE